VVDFQVASETHDLTLVSFPTGKSGWNDIGRRQQEELKSFVHEKARAIGARAVRVKPVPPRI
jgi:predicted GTPase